MNFPKLIAVIQLIQSLLYVIRLINWYKGYDVDLPIFFSIVQNASWPIQLFMYYRELSTLPETRVITSSMYRSYAFLGVLASFISLTRMFGLSSLTPILYVVAANTEIVFETLMTRFGK